VKRTFFATIASLGAFVIVFVARPAQGHPVDSASLALTEIAPGRFAVKWQAGSSSLQESLTTAVNFPAICHLEGRYLDCGRSDLVGTIEFPWLSGTLTHVMVDIDWRDHTRLLRTVTASSPRLVVYGAPASRGLRFLLPIAVDYTGLGIEHILTGTDHLLFVVALTMLVRRGRRLLATITAFTLAHSLSLAATVLGLVSVPAAPVEATIALSIVLICAEAARPPSPTLAQRAPWLVAFAFGLLHGLGFASALLEIGLPQSHVPLALLFFNVGVELGQVGVIGVVMAIGSLVARLQLRKPWWRRGVLYAMGTLAATWSWERISAVFGR
jgi:hydrogenase/urease accessory protein HupE